MKKNQVKEGYVEFDAIYTKTKTTLIYLLLLVSSLGC